jgi:hypothetical protein
VFSQFTSHLALVREKLDEKGVRYLYLDGQTPESERIRRVDAFQAGEADLFLISLKAGGTGLNLTAADYVVHLDPWWNPAVEDQATDRAHRIGQSKPVTVYRLVSKGTIEEAILALHEEKRNLVAGVLDGAGAAAKLSNEELMALIRAGEAAPDVELDRGEEVEQADVADEPVVAPGAPAPGAPGVAGGVKLMAWLIDDFRAWLDARNPQHHGPVLSSSRRALPPVRQPRTGRLGAERRLASTPRPGGPYREALQSGSFPAPRASRSWRARLWVPCSGSRETRRLVHEPKNPTLRGHRVYEHGAIQILVAPLAGSLGREETRAAISSWSG